ncbi:MAG TPA: hypothetical protein DCQ98_17260 [Planctomycetaceae bacterium]|nr:hypothetical protein [Planctomycetaceae bacterium]HRF01167.1 GNAT family N-acetyltransferase [Pirellulaceae bacterium]
MPRLSWLTSIDRFAAIADDWNSLVRTSPCLRHEWLDAWFRSYGRSSEMRVAWVTADDGSPLGGLAAVRTRHLVHGRLMSLAGSGHACSDGIGVIAAPGHEAEVVETIAEAFLRRTEAGAPSVRWDEWEWDGVAADDRTTGQLIERLLPDEGRRLECGILSTWRIAFPDQPWGITDYCSRKTRRKLKQLQRRFDSGEVTLRFAEGRAEFERAQDLVVELHQKRRRSLGEPGCFADPLFGPFYAAASSALFDRGLWKIVWIEHQGKPIGIQTGPFFDRYFYSYQTGIDPESIRLEPGWLVQIGLLRSAIDERWRGIDYMRGDEEYKQKLGCTPTAVRHVRGCHSRWTARSRFAMFQLARDAKHWWDSVPNTLPSLPVAATASANSEANDD